MVDNLTHYYLCDTCQHYREIADFYICHEGVQFEHGEKLTISDLQEPHEVCDRYEKERGTWRTI